MADKGKLKDMLDSLIDDNSDAAQVDFHSYLGDKMKEVAGTADVSDDDSTLNDNNEDD